MPSPARIQHHFSFGKLNTIYHNFSPSETELDKRKFVTDSRGVTSKASLNEYNVAEALKLLNKEFYFQMSIEGGKQRAFGLVLDFLVITVPFPTPVWVHGEHWHTGARRQKDIYQQTLVSDYMQGQINPPLEIWGSESTTVEQALRTLKNKGLV